ncbi:ABC transporter ATP-binding protein [Jiangella aurantiaca]|uniref:ABC transporter ATP-binding protein n=1 Tax=Jiangella aurantiaca TaxID=2530373 RepID=A0A4R5AHB1_9ACTN|nr:ABC transporter ATP-binding protein [Jiangella aurantiaca]TDD70689.1 ABC transporter ATP-binding protein [Jiangella aurantiaca]
MSVPYSPPAEERPTPELPTRAKVRLLWSYARPHQRVLVAGLLLGLLGTGAELVTPLVTKSVLDGLEVDASLRGPVTLLAVLLVAGAVIGLVQTILLGTLAERIILAARTGMVRHLLRTKVTELGSRSAGEMVTRVTSDTMLIREATTSSMVNAVNGLVGLVGALALMAYLDLVLLATTLGVIVVVAILAALLMPKLAKAQQEAQEEIGALGGRLEGVLRALRTVKAARAEARETSRIARHAERSAEKSIRAVKLEAWAWTITGGGINLAVMLILGVGAYRVAAGHMTVTTLVAFLLYAFQLMMPVMLLTMSLTSVQSGLAAAARIGEIDAMATETDAPTAAPAPTQLRADAALELRDVEFRYSPEAAPALAGVSLTIPRHGHTAIIGPSGAGKTTIFSLLLKFLQPQGGEIVLDGRPFADWTLADLRSRIAYVEQDTPLVPGTLRENLGYAAPDATEDELWAALATVRLDQRVRELEHGLDTLLSPTTMSGGERQRVALARALAADAELLLLDEATAQLDGLSEAAVAEGIRRQATTGAVVTIAHRLSTVVDADQILLLEAGRVRAVGTHQELLAADELYRELVAALRIATGPQPVTTP